MQHFLWGKVVLALVAIVAVLQVVHLVLLSRLEARHHSRHNTASQELVPASATGGGANLQEVESMFSLLTTSLEQGRLLDAAGEYQLVPHLASPSPSASRRPSQGPQPDTTLVTHCSRQHLRLIPALLQRWQGPVSVAVYAEESDVPSALWWVSRLRCCHVAVRHNVSFHLVSPLSSATGGGARTLPLPPPPWRDASILQAQTDLCGMEGRIDEDLTPNYVSGQGQGRYPNNLLRNVARRGASTEFVMVVDIDMVPSKNLRKDFYEFAVKGRLFSESKREDKTVYVVPAFEVASSVAPPQTKRELLQLADGGQLRPFYFELCWKCQVHTDYEAWQKEPPSQGLAPLFEVLWKDPWEPFYIARNTVPFYDERFKQYGFNRISQVCELHVAGYKFSVLNNGFLVHRGLKTAASFHPSKDVEQERNRMLFRQFKVELRDKYPESSRRCY